MLEGILFRYINVSRNSVKMVQYADSLGHFLSAVFVIAGIGSVMTEDEVQSLRLTGAETEAIALG